MEGLLRQIRGLRVKLISVFLLVGLLPLLGTLWVATRTVSEMQEKEAIAKLNNAVLQSQRYMEREGKRLAMVAYMAVKDGHLITEDMVSSRAAALKMRRDQDLDFVCVRKGGKTWGDPDIGFHHVWTERSPNYGITTVIYRGEDLPALIGISKEKGLEGIAGKLITTSFLENLEELTGVDVGIWLKNGREWGIPEGLSAEEREDIQQWLTRVTNKGVPLYNDNLKMEGQQYKTIFLPLKDWQGKALGMFIFNLEPGESFQALLLGNRYFMIIMGLGIILSVFLGWWVAGRITEPVRRFAASADNIAKGDYSLQVPLTRRRDEIGDLARAFERMRLGLKEAQRREKLASLGELSAGLAHEIRNPLGIVKNAAEGLISKERDETQREMLLDIIIQETKRLNKLVTDFLDFARPTPVEKTEISLKELVEDIVFSVEDEANKRGVEIIPDLENVVISIDKYQIRQALLNLILNSLDAMPEGGEIRISLVKEKESATLRIEDSGQGISPEHLDKIFDPFFTTKEKGTGLGLALVYRIVEAHGGEIKVDSREGVGTTFVVTLPF